MRSTHRQTLAALLVLAVACSSSGPFAELTVLGTNVGVRATARPAFSAGVSGRRLSVGDVLRTDPTGFGQVDYFEGGVTRLDVSTTLVIRELALRAERRVRVHLDAGRTWNRVDELTSGERFEVETPVAVASVRGTAFVVVCDAAGCTFIVVEGVVRIRTITGEEVLLRAGQAVGVDRAGRLGKVVGVVPQNDFWIVRNLARDQGRPEPTATAPPTPAPTPARRAAPTPRPPTPVLKGGPTRIIRASTGPELPDRGNGTEAGFAVRWSRQTDDPSSGAQMSRAIEGSTGRSGWFKHSSPTVADLAGDARKEIVIGSLDGKVYVWNADGSRAAGWPRKLDAGSTPAGPINSTPAVGDIDADGERDVVVGSDNGWVFAFGNDGTIKPGWPQFTGNNADYPQNCASKACTDVPASPTLADLNGDRKLEVIVGSYSHKMWVWRSDGSVMPGWPRDVYDGIFSSAAVGDLNRDGAPDIVVGSDMPVSCSCPPYGPLQPGGVIHAFRVDGTELPGWPKQTDAFAQSSPALADLDGDGSQDVVVAGGFFESGTDTRGHHVYAFRADGSLMWRFDTPTGTAGVITASVAVGDVTGDGRPEVAVGDQGGTMRLLRPTGDEMWWRAGTRTPNGGYFWGPVLADVTGDGVPEVVAADGNWHVKAWSASGDTVGDSSLLNGVTRFSMWNSPAVADLDGDGTNEVVAGSAAGDGSGQDIPTQAGHGEIWVIATRGRGALLWPQFHTRTRTA